MTGATMKMPRDANRSVPQPVFEPGGDLACGPSEELRTIWRLRSNRKASKTAEYFVLKYPHLVFWMMRRYPTLPLSNAFRELVTLVDQKPFITRCSRCANRAIRATAYSGTSSLQFWCDKHEPTSQDRLTTIATFADALSHVDLTRDAPVSAKQEIIRALAWGKGLRQLLREVDALQFFTQRSVAGNDRQVDHALS
jgi:hypothetical protein